jgi:hypothetical protein
MFNLNILRAKRDVNQSHKKHSSRLETRTIIKLLII